MGAIGLSSRPSLEGACGSSALVPGINFQFRAYDGTRQWLRVLGDIPVGDGVIALEPTAAKYEVNVAASSKAFCMSRGSGTDQKWLTFISHLEILTISE